MTDADCDETDAGAFPGADEIAGDGVDQDCDGADAPEEDTGGSEETCGCASDGGSGGLFGMIGAMGLVASRRRR